ncbi:hypothetical protein DNHGIG_10480 [Collibacillus ludicampi]|uniref:Flagellar protein FlaG n=1 Tax=Collibacillus ludicampi TaxID=2771369 RepID=A0AAV4LCW3_9BACL|nr:flagellar protein FlaG [Collibacillus ludicampi]GIM45499.1 hypothetical protein DNHGIG_10480 [Collibacillus ludicampi]
MDMRIPEGSASTLRKNPSPNETDLYTIEHNPRNNQVNQKGSHVTTEIERKLKQLLDTDRQYLQFSIDQENHRIRVKVIDEATGKIIREIPPESIEKTLRDLARLAGVWVDCQA